MTTKNQQQWLHSGLAICCGGLSALGYAPYGYVFLWFLSLPFIAYLALFISHDQTSFSISLRSFWRPHRQAFFIGWLFGGAYFTTGLYWVGQSFFVKGGWYSYIAPIAILSFGFGLGIFTAVTYWLISYCRILLQVPFYSVRMILLISMVWSAFDLLRGVVLTGFPWQIPGYIWYLHDNIVQSVSVIGVQGLGLITLILVHLPLLWWPFIWKKHADIDRFNRKKPKSLAVISFSVAFILLFLLLGWLGRDRLQHHPTAYQADVRFRVVQSSIDPNDKWNPKFRDRNLADYIYRSQADGFDQVTHVIWPETALPFNIDLFPDLLKRTAFAVPPEGYLLTGALRSERVPWDQDISEKRWIFRNSFVALDEEARIVSGYHKSHLVPFGEYVPLSDTALLRWLRISLYDFSPGPGLTQIKLPGLPSFVPLICYEILFPGQVMPKIDALNERPEWILNLTNDAWFGTSSGPYQHLQIARYRGIEEGLPVIRAANTGISMVFDAYGRYINGIDLMVKGYFDSYLPKPADKIPYFAKWYHLPLYLTLVVLFVYQFIGYIINRQ